MMGSSASPLPVSWYSTRGGTSGYVRRSTMPSSSSARRRRLSVRGLMPSSERSSSQKREQPSARSRTSRSVHFAQTTSAVAQTGQVSLVTGNTLPNEARAPAGTTEGPAGAGPSKCSGAVALGDIAELLSLREGLQLLQRLVLDLADALARDVERPPDLVERARVLPAQAVAQLEHTALAVRQVLQRLAQGFLGEDLGGALVRRLRALVGDELAELRLLLVADRLLERDRRLRAALDRLDLLRLDPRDLGDLVGGGLAPELGDELALGPADLVELLDDVHGDANRPGLVGQGARDRLADPPGRVRRELEALAVVELLRGADEAERSLLDEVQERQPLVAVVLGDGDDEPEVRLDHLLLGIEIAALDALGEVDFLLRCEEPDLADVLQEQLERVGRHVRPQIQRRLLRAAAALVRRALDLVAGSGSRIDVLDQLDLLGLEELVELLDVGLVEVELLRGRLDLGVREDAELLTLGEQALDLFELLQLYD